MKLMKIFAYVIGGVVALVIVGLVLLVLLFDPNDYKDDLARVVEKETGRQLTLEGDLSLSVFPWIAIELGRASLGDAPGFGDEPFVAIERARLGVRLLPLLSGRVEIGDLLLDQPRVKLVTDAKGRNNWDDLAGERPAPEETPAAAEPAVTPTVASITIRGGEITVRNLREKTSLALREVELETGRLASGKPVDLEAGFVFEQDASLQAKTALQSKLTADFEAQRFSLTEPRLEVELRGEGFPAAGVPLSLRSESVVADVASGRYELAGSRLSVTWAGEGMPDAGLPVSLDSRAVVADLEAGTLSVTDLLLEAAGARVSGSLAGEHILDAPELTGAVTLAPVSLRELLQRVGVDVPVTSDPGVLTSVALEGRLKATSKSLELSKLVLKLDDTTARGSLGVADISRQALRFDLDVDRIDADRYLPPAADGEGGGAAEEPTEIPVEMLRKLNVKGQLRVGEAIFAGMKFSGVNLAVNARDGKVRLHPSEASMYGGRYQGDIRMDATGAKPTLGLDERVTGIDFAPLFKDLFETDRVSGRGNGTARLSATGLTSDEMVGSLNGNIGFDVTGGALEGVDLWYEIRRARALFDQKPVPARTGPERTPFTALKGTGTVRDGIVANNDLQVAMQYLDVKGAGTVDLVKDALNYKLDATVLKMPAEGAETAGMQDMVGARIPVTITGPLSDPKVRPDVEGYLKDKARQKLEEEKDKVEQKLRDKLQDKLKDIFGDG